MTERIAGKFGLNNEYEQLRSLAPLTDYFGKHLPTPPTSIDYYTRIENALTMAMNDQLGDCVIAGFEHVLQLQAALAGTTFAYPGDQETESVYFGLTGGADTGLQLSQAIAAASCFR